MSSLNVTPPLSLAAVHLGQITLNQRIIRTVLRWGGSFGARLHQSARVLRAQLNLNPSRNVSQIAEAEASSLRTMAADAGRRW